MNKFQKFVEISKALFNPREHDNRCFHTTFLLKKGKIVSIGVNSNKTNPRNLKYDYTARNGIDIRHIVGTHSEMSAIIKYGKEDISDCIVINVRVGRNGKIANSMPCAGCLSLFRQVGYRRLFYSNVNGEFQEYIA